MRFSVFYQLPISSGQVLATRYAETIEQIQVAEQLGFSVAWLAEAHFRPEFSSLPTPLLFLANVASRTERIRLGTAATQIPLHHPLRLAEEGAMLDVLSGGRLELGVGRGPAPFPLASFGVSQAEVNKRFVEGLSVVRQAWTHEQFSFRGEFFQIRQLGIVPRPIQKPTPPIRVTTNSAETAIWSAKEGLPIMIGTVANPLPSLFHEHIELYRQNYRHNIDNTEISGSGIGVDSGQTGEVSAVVMMYPAPSQAATEAEYLPSLNSYLGGILGRRAASYAEVNASLGFVGESAKIASRLRALQERANLTELICWFNPGGLVEHRVVLAAMERFAKEVMPLVVATTE
jgi:alkanesulfonate monooxygenase SsuD/methylene tetrahydromethanopterin reductase-like flavin-dependent oxidoreductase (luciferase family)